MSYARIDDLLPHDPRWAAVRGAEVPSLLGWMTAAHAYAERHRTDGVVLRAQLGFLVPHAGRPTARTLGLLELGGFLARLPDQDGWMIVNYFDHNSPAAIRSERARLNARTRWAGHAAKHDASGNASGTMPGSMLLPSHSPPTPLKGRSSVQVTAIVAPPTGPDAGFLAKPGSEGSDGSEPRPADEHLRCKTCGTQWLGRPPCPRAGEHGAPVPGRPPPSAVASLPAGGEP